MYCNVCKKEISEDSKFCTYCGSPIRENNIDSEELLSLAEQIKDLKYKKELLELDISKLYKAKELTLNIKKLEKKELILNSDIEQLENKKSNLEKDINNLKEQKAILIDDIDNISLNKKVISSPSDLTIDYIDSLNDGLAFETYFSELLDRLGFYDINVTNGSGDFGIDVLAYNDDILYGFQCKLYSSPVGNKSVQEAYAGKNHYNCNVAVVVTNNSFTEQARKQSKETNVILWDRTTLINKLEEANKMDFTFKM